MKSEMKRIYALNKEGLPVRVFLINPEHVIAVEADKEKNIISIFCRDGVHITLEGNENLIDGILNLFTEG